MQCKNVNPVILGVKMKITLKDIKRDIKYGYEATKEYILDPITALFKSKKIQNYSELSDYIRNESAKVIQQTLYEYVRNRMGIQYVKLHDDEKFLESLNIAKWNIYTVALQDLLLYTHSIIDNFYKKDFTNLELENFYKKILDLEINQGLNEDLLDKKNVEFKLRLHEVDLKNFHKQQPFKKSSLALFYWAPIADELKKEDRNIVLNSIFLKWKNIEKDFPKLINL